MAGDIKIKYGDSNQDCQCTLTSLASAAAKSGAVQDNTANQFIDALVGGKITNSGSTPVAGAYANVYAYGTVNDSAAAPTYTEGATGSDTTITLTSPTNLRLIGVINMPTCAATYKFGPFSVAMAFGGVLPRKWGVVVENKTGQGLSSSATDHDVRYQGVYAQYT